MCQNESGMTIGLRNCLFCTAEREGFEPPVGCPTTVFKTAAFDRSATSPRVSITETPRRANTWRSCFFTACQYH